MKHVGYNEPDPVKESFDYLTEMVMTNSTLTEEQARKITRAWLHNADLLVADE